MRVLCTFNFIISFPENEMQDLNAKESIQV